MYFKAAWKSHVKSILLLAVLVSIFYSTYRIANNLLLSYITSFFAENSYISLAVYIVLLLLMVSTIHCALHYIAYKLFGGSIFKRSGIVSNRPVEKGWKELNHGQNTLVTLFPLVVISIICTTIPGWIGQLLFICNILVSIGDIYDLFNAKTSNGKGYEKAAEFNNDIIEINIW